MSHNESIACPDCTCMCAKFICRCYFLLIMLDNIYSQACLGYLAIDPTRGYALLSKGRENVMPVRRLSEQCNFYKHVHACVYVHLICFITYFGEATHFHDSFPLAKNALHSSTSIHASIYMYTCHCDVSVPILPLSLFVK